MPTIDIAGAGPAGLTAAIVLARRRLRKSIAVAKRFSMAYEELRASELLAPILEQKERVELDARAELLRSLIRNGTPADRRLVDPEQERPESASVANH